MIGFSIFTLILVGLSFIMSKRQNINKDKTKMGGNIAPAKSFWLFYCIYTWFLLMPFVLVTQELPQELEVIWIGFVAWMYFRGIVEMVMMFITKNWIPPIGIGHDISCVVWLVLGSIYFIYQGASIPLHYGIFHLSLILSLVMETYYAIKFYEVVGGKTKGDDAIWYANKEDAVFKKVVKVTALLNIPLYSCLIYFVLSLTL